MSALGGIRTPNLLIRSQMLYPLSYKRREKVDRRVYPPGRDGGRREGMGRSPHDHVELVSRRRVAGDITRAGAGTSSWASTGGAR